MNKLVILYNFSCRYQCHLFSSSTERMDDCVLGKNPIKTLYNPNSQTGFNGTLLRMNMFLNRTLSRHFRRKTKETIGKTHLSVSSSSAFCAAGLPTWLSSRLSYLDPVLSSLTPDVGTLTFADKEVVDFLAPWRVPEAYRLKVIPVDRSSCIRRSRPVP